MKGLEKPVYLGNNEQFGEAGPAVRNEAACRLGQIVKAQNWADFSFMINIYDQQCIL